MAAYETASGRGSFARRAAVAVGILLLAATIWLLLWYAIDVLLLIFAGLLVAVLLRGLSDWLSARTKLSQGWSLTVVVVLLLGLCGVGAWLLAPRVAAQVDQLAENLPRAVQSLAARLEQYQWGRWLLAQTPNAEALMFGRQTVLTRVTGVFSTTLGALANLLIVLFIGLYLATDPHLYLNGIVRLVPVAHRPRAREVLSAVGDTLRRWLMGRLALMLINGVLTALGLWLLGVPLALTLGILAGLLNFIPNIGPIIAGVPAVLLALMQSPTQALYVLLLYFVLQMTDGYLLTPLVDKRTVSLPPALTIAAQVLMGVLLGGLALVLASPLTAAALVFIRMLYVQDTLESKDEG